MPSRENPLDLGLIGLAEFPPLPLLALPAGHIADRLPRPTPCTRRPSSLEGLVAGGLIVVTLAGASSLWPFLLLAARRRIRGPALGWPAARSMPPTLVSTTTARARRDGLAGNRIPDRNDRRAGHRRTDLRGAGLASSTSLQPRCSSWRSCCILGVNERKEERLLGGGAQPRGAIRRCALRLRSGTPVLFGAISLDLFAVLFGGAMALLPLFARDILDTGPVGLGICGARPPSALSPRAFSSPSADPRQRGPDTARRGGDLRSGDDRLRPLEVVPTLLYGVGPRRLRGHVQHEHPVDDGGPRHPRRASGPRQCRRDGVHQRLHELGAFESGIAAALIGAVPAVVLGGVATIVIAGLWWRFFPDLRRVDRLELLRPASEP